MIESFEISKSHMKCKYLYLLYRFRYGIILLRLLGVKTSEESFCILHETAMY